MPKGAIDEDGNAPSDPREVWCAWRATVVTPPATHAGGVEGFAQDHLRAGVLSPDGGHDPAPLLRCPGVCQDGENNVAAALVPGRRAPGGAVRLASYDGTVVSVCPEKAQGAGRRPLDRRRPIAVDLFAGAGGFALGFEQAGFDVVAALEYDPIHAAVHKFNFPRTEVVCANASRVTAAEIRAAVERGVAARSSRANWDGEIDVVFGGPPCQGFSSGGRRRVGDDRNLLVFDFLRLVTELRPSYFAMENVPPMKNYIEERTLKLLDRFMLEIEAAGYEVVKPPQVLNAARYGVPQDRRRLIVLGARKGHAHVLYPLPSVRPVKKRRADDPKPWEVGGREADESLPLGPTVAEAISDIPDLDRFAALWKVDAVVLDESIVAAMNASASPYARRLRGLDDDPSDYSYRRKWNPELLTGSMRTAHTLTSIERFRKTPQGEAEPISRYYRLDEDGLCSTLRAGTGYERGSFMAPRPIHPTRHRVISPREAARLHSFPDWFRFHETKWHAFRQIGNSLPPLLGRAIGAEFMKALGVKPVKPQRAIETGDLKLLSFTTREAAQYFDVDINNVPSHKLRHRKRPLQPSQQENVA
jgi:DNA (cytosine-5)-methyltransferase 1